MFEEISKTGIFNEFYINNDMPETVVKWLKKKGVSLSTNCEFFDVTRKSIIIELISTLFKERKADKKEAFKYKHLAQDAKDELARRGISI